MIKISLLADDLTLILPYCISIENTLKIRLCIKINIEKTKEKRLGTPITAGHYPHGLSWSKTSLETLGIYITNTPLKPKL